MNSEIFQIMEKAREYVIKKMNECFLFTHKDYPQYIFYIWDKQKMREKKLLRLTDKEEMKFKLGKNSIFLFQQDNKYKSFYYDYFYIYKVLKEKYLLNEQQIRNLFKSIIKEDNKLKILLVEGWGVLPVGVATIEKLSI